MHRHQQHTCIGARSNDQQSQPPKACLDRSPAKGADLSSGPKPAWISWRRPGPGLGTSAVEIGCESNHPERLAVGDENHPNTRPRR